MFHKKEFHDLVLSPHESTLGIQDAYDAGMWKTFLFNPLDSTEGFLSDPQNIALLLNIDWFKPYKRSEYKVSAVMLTILNLPREERFKDKWTMIVGIIPGPTEPKGNINTYLKPLVDDLLSLCGVAYICTQMEVLRKHVY